MKLKKIAAVALVVSMSIGSAVHAATRLPSNEKASDPVKKSEAKEQHFKAKGHMGIFRAAEEMGIDKEKLKDAKLSGKNFFDLAKEKGYTEQQAREILIKNNNDAINKAVQEGKITKEKADEVLTRSKKKLMEWDGIFKPHRAKEKNNQ